MRRRTRGGVDWVYRGDRWAMRTGGDHGDAVAADQEEPLVSGTYASVIPGILNDERLAQVLVDSDRNARAAALAGIITPATGLPDMAMINPAANPDEQSEGPLIHGCDIEMYVYVGTGDWQANVSWYMGMRIIVAEQDPYDGTAMLHTNYHMWGQVSGVDTITSNPAEYANGRQSCWETRVYRDRQRTNEQLAAHVVRFRPRFKRRLAHDEGLFLYLEPHPNSVTLEFIQLFCRTLVSKRN